MIVYGRHKRTKILQGAGLVNTLINKLPGELHLPGYQYCGPGTKLAERLARGDPGINSLDAACKVHDIAYSKNRENIAARNQADQILADSAWHRVFARDARFGEKIAAWAVANTMKVKGKLGMGIPKKMKIVKKKSGTRKKITALKKVITAAKNYIKPGQDPLKAALAGARDAVRKAGGKKKIRLPRIIPIPTKIGGFLPFIIPIFAGLSAVGALTGGAASVIKAINDSNAAKRQLEETKRHNSEMEAITVGKGLYLQPHKKGMGLFLKPSSKN